MSDFKCNNCKEDIDIHEHELFELYTEDGENFFNSDETNMYGE